MSQDESGMAPIPTVFIDASPFSYRRLTGLSRYTARLALALASHAPVRFFHPGREILASDNSFEKSEPDLARWARRIWRGRRVPLVAPPPDSIGVYGSVRPHMRLFPFEVSVLHDFSPLVLPQTHLPRTVAQFQRFLGCDLLRSDLALADSPATKADASWLSPFDPERIIVAPPGPSLCVERHLHSRPVSRRPHVGLVVSTVEPRKNARFFLEWFQNTEVLPSDAELWWVGSQGWLTSRRELRGYHRSGRRRTVRMLGNVSDTELCRLYQEVGWSAYPSLYEGFGFPVLDALRHGVPVLTASHSALREFRGPGVHVFDPHVPSTVDQAWTAFQQDRSVAIPRGPLDQRFNWHNVARILLDSCRRVRHPHREPSIRAA